MLPEKWEANDYAPDLCAAFCEGSRVGRTSAALRSGDDRVSDYAARMNHLLPHQRERACCYARCACPPQGVSPAMAGKALAKCGFAPKNFGSDSQGGLRFSLLCMQPAGGSRHS